MDTTSRVLVTGHRGYIGSVLVPLLQEEGWDIVGMDSDLYRRCNFLAEPLEVPTLERDIRDVDAGDLRGVDAVLHLAALSNDPLGSLNPELTYAINHHASVRLARLAKASGVRRFIFSSSCSTYGAADGDGFLDENAGFNPVTAYGRSKVLAEQDISPLAGPTFSPVFLRNATAYGLSPRHRFDLVLNNLVAWAHATGEVYIKSDGTPWRPLVHVEDICHAFRAALRAPLEIVHNRAFNVGAPGENYRIREIAEIVRETVPGSKIRFSPDGEPDRRSYRVDFGRIERSLPGFQPRWNVRAGAEQLYEAYKKTTLSPEEFEGARYRRVDHIQTLRAAGALDAELRWMTSTAAGRPRTVAGLAKHV